MPGSLALVDFVTDTVAEGSTVRTHGAPMMRRLPALGYPPIPIDGYRAADPATVLPGVHLVASLLKRWLVGTLHYGVERGQLPYYLDEFTFRFNRHSAKSRGRSSTACSSKP